MNYRLLLIGILLVGLLVGTVSATVTSINFSLNEFVTEDNDGSWATLHGGNGDTELAVTTYMGASALANESSNFYSSLGRTVISSNTATLPDTDIIDSATVFIHKNFASSGLGQQKLILVNATPLDKSSLVSGDFARTGFVKLSNNMTYAQFTGWCNFTLNSDGLAAIDKTGWSSFMIVLENDADTTDPAWSPDASSLMYIDSVAGTGGSYTPNVSITHHAAAAADIGITTIYPMNASYINETQILPNSDTNLPPTGLNVSANLSPGQFGSTAFVIKPNQTVTDYMINATDLTDVTNASNTISKDNTTIRLVIPWYQAHHGDIQLDWTVTPTNVHNDCDLEPELLVYNKSLISCNYTNQNCSVWVKNDTYEGLFAIDNTTIGQWRADYKVYNNKTEAGFPVNFSLADDINQQVWMTTYVPIGTPAGNYTGKIKVNSSIMTPIAVNYTIRVYNITLLNATKEHAIYYRGTIQNDYVKNTPSYELDFQEKTNANYQIELADIRDHGIKYPTNYQKYYADNPDWTPYFNTTLTYRAASGMPTDKMYIADTENLYTLLGDSTPDYAALNATLLPLITGVTEYGFGQVYQYGIDEPSLVQYNTEYNTLMGFRTAGAKTYSALPALNSYINESIDTVNTPGTYDGAGWNETLVALWKAAGTHKVFIYGNPQMGVENPELYREQYGFRLWISGYDGVMDYAYQHTYPMAGDYTQQPGYTIWNDFDSIGGAVTSTYRDHVMAYPITNGVIDTIQWEGYREGVDDDRIATTLSFITGNTTEATTIINDGIAAGDDMSVIRQHIIDHILAYGSEAAPVVNFTANKTSVCMYEPVQFNDTSTNTPTTWQWVMTPGGWDSHSQNISHEFDAVGIYSVNLTAGNAVGENFENKTDYITVTDCTPVAAFTGTPLIGNPGLITSFTDATTNTPTEWHWYCYDNETESSNTQDSSCAFAAVGNYSIRLNATNDFGSDWENKTDYVNVTNATVPTPGAGTTSGWSLTGITAAIVGALALIGVMLIGGGTLMIVNMFRSGTMGRDDSVATSPSGMGLGIAAITVGALLLVMAYIVINPLFILAGA